MRFLSELSAIICINPQGGGEPAIICMGVVIANAIFNATSARLYLFTMTPEPLLETLQKV
jgi:isoquinoline 1-oxidoreductase